MGNIMYYYASAHTGKGYVQYWESNIKDIKKRIVLQHPSLHYKTLLFKKIIAEYIGEREIEVVLSPFGESDIEGVIIREDSLAILNDSYVSNVSDIIELEDTRYVREGVDSFEKQINDICLRAYEKFSSSLSTHDQLENIYIREMDFQKADRIIDHLKEELFQFIEPKSNPSKMYERLFGTKTPEGTTNYLESLIEPMEKRFFIKGRAGTGKSHLMRSIVETSKTYGLNIEIYRCSFDPESIDLVIIRELQVCLFDSTPPHELEPTRREDVIIDLYDKTVTAGTDEKYAQTIEKVNEAYIQKMKEGVSVLREIVPIQKKIDALFNLDQINMDEIVEHIKND